MKNRQCRLQENPPSLLYHQTNGNAARAIRKSRRMLRGTTGMAGGGIYFATTKSDTNHKSQKGHGWMIHAGVRLGRVKSISAEGDQNITFWTLQAEGYDSVYIPRSNGGGYVVYNYDQVEILKVRRRCCWSNW